MRNCLVLLFIFLFIPCRSQTWNTVSNGMGNDIHGFTLFNSELVIGGSFNGNPADHIVSWDGANWSAFGNGTDKVVRAVAEWNGNLVACGDFWNVGQPCIDCNGIAMWNGSAWEALGTGMNNDVLALTVWNGNLIAAGDFTSVNGDTSIKRVAMWDGVTWSAFHTGFNNDVRALAVFNGELVAGGDFSNASGNGAADRIARWDVADQEWKKLVSPGGLDSTVRVLRVINGELYMGGHFIEVAGNTDCKGIARYDGIAWYPLGTGVNSYVRAIAEYAGEIYIGGDFTIAGSTAANRIARWNGATWQALTSGVTAYIRALEVFNGELYVGGSFHEAGGLVADYIARWTMPLPLSSGVSTVPATCSGICDGEATVTYSGGTAPYTVIWSPGNQTTSTISGLCAGNYSVTITDSNGSSLTQTITITNSSSVTATANITSSYNGYDISCFGESDGTAEAISSGGTPPYSYLWSLSAGSQTSATIANLPAGSHSVTITDNNGCEGMATITISQPPPVQSVIAGSDVSCHGENNGSANVGATGGVPPYGFSWSTAETSSTVYNLPAGNYSVIITDQNGCTDQQTIIISEPSSIDITLTKIDIDCTNGQSGSASSVITGGSPGYNYSWNTIPAQTTSAATNLTAGNYTLTVTDMNGCTEIKTVAINQTGSLTGMLSSVNTDQNCTGEATATMTNGSGTYSYLWDTMTGSQATATASGLCAGNYCVEVTDANGCQFTDCADVLLINGINEAAGNMFEVFPNPAERSFFIRMNTDKVFTVSLYDMNGKQIPFAIYDENDLIEIVPAELQPGIYLMILTSDNGTLQKKKIVFQ